MRHNNPRNAFLDAYGLFMKPLQTDSLSVGTLHLNLVTRHHELQCSPDKSGRLNADSNLTYLTPNDPPKCFHDRRVTNDPKTQNSHYLTDWTRQRVVADKHCWTRGEKARISNCVNQNK